MSQGEAGQSPPGADNARWWRRRPRTGVLFSLAVGLGAFWMVRGLAGPAAGDSAFVHLVTLPIALLLPALSIAAGLIGWQSWRAGGSPPWLAVPLFAGLVAHALAVGLFVRIVAALFGA